MLCMLCQQASNDVLTFKLPGCNHLFCASCLCQYLKTFTSANIKCPLFGCAQLILKKIIIRCLSNDDLELYDAYCSYANVHKCLTKECPYYAAVLYREGCLVCPLCMQSNCLNCANLHTKYEYCGASPKKKYYEDQGRINLSKRIRKDNRLLLSTKGSECDVCLTFSLPREGYFISQCMHHFCRQCLISYLKSIQTIEQLKCMCCYVPLNIEDCEKFMDIKDFERLKFKLTKHTKFYCQTPDCTSHWETEEDKKNIKCDICQMDNCVSCRAIHEGETCQNYKSSPQFRRREETLQVAKMQKAFNCYNCNTLVIKEKKGCNALQCNQCGKQLCAFTGMRIGPVGCKCRMAKRCHKDCKGCIPEGYGPDVEELKTYFYTPL